MFASLSLNKILSQKGSALMNAIVVSGIIAAISAVILTQTQETDQSSRAPRIRSELALMQARVQALASQYTSYICATPNDYKACKINPSVFSKSNLHEIVRGAKCPTQAACGIAVSSPSFNPNTLIFSATISYEGTEVSISPINIQFKVPADIISSSMQYLCPSATPIFQGYDSTTGKILCIPFPTTCAAGSNGVSLSNQGTYVAGLDPTTLNPICNVMGDGSQTTCVGGYLSNYSWKKSGPNSGFTSTCTARKNPFTVLPFSPGAPTTTGPSITVVYTGGGPPPPPTTTTLPPGGPGVPTNCLGGDECSVDGDGYSGNPYDCKCGSPMHPITGATCHLAGDGTWYLTFTQGAGWVNCQ